jgi:glycosyltransferase involved in cell wall biosynthesis
VQKKNFRLDGESFGLNIAESMLAGNPIITHKSHIWNAHLEYLKPEFSLVVEKDDVEGYKDAIKTLVALKYNNPQEYLKMESCAKETGENLFIMKNNIGKIEDILESIRK